MGAEGDPEGTGRLRLLAPLAEWNLFMLGGCSQTSSSLEEQRRLGDELPAITGLDRGARGAFSFVNGLGLTIESPSQVVNLNTVMTN
jgi:hypothetical protein